jgi:nucleotide sugar dehydrogenase
MKFTPGPGVGGHCLPIDPTFLAWQVQNKLGLNFRFIELANSVNRSMPKYVVQRLSLLLNDRMKPIKGSTILVLGLSYKQESEDIRESPSLEVIELLVALGARVQVCDPLISEHSWPKHLQRVSLNAETTSRVDAALLMTNHSVFNYDQLSGIPVLDTRNAGTGAHAERL